MAADDFDTGDIFCRLVIPSMWVIPLFHRASPLVTINYECGLSISHEWPIN